MADTSGKELSYGRTLIAGMLMADWIRKRHPNDRMVGIMLPASVGGALANIGVLMAGKVPVNLNFTAGKEALNSAIEQCRIGTILTSRVFLTKAKLEHRPGMVFLEDLLQQFSRSQKLLAALKARLVPARVLETLFKPAKLTPSDLATVIFSSGSTGLPKGVMLSHQNVISNVNSMAQLFSLTKRDTIAGVLPFFHCFGFTVTLWLPLLMGMRVAYHPDPLDAKAVGGLVSRYKATLFLGTPTFCKAYTRVCSREQFSSLRYVIVGAEKLQESVARGFEEKFGLSLLEGYGCTEMSPVVAVNVRDVEDRRAPQAGSKPGTVGRPIPGVSAKVVDPDTGEALPHGKEGLLLVNGPNRMLGYLNQPKKTEEVLRDGWYVTGDIAMLDEDGFIRITDRLSRFSKIGGEMVPHLRVEEAVLQFLGEYSCAVTAIPDERKGERLVVLHTRQEMSARELWEGLSRSELPKLWVPRPENIYYVETLPTLGSGKLNLRVVKTVAMSLAAGEKARAAAKSAS
jgi:acyl-[acyl-carrier-protein]-phospholipid O-acyltransferase/long-chain-fatty-acid--[acyl-carrier-protein] ligase